MAITMHSTLALSPLLESLDSVQLRWLKIVRGWCTLAHVAGGLDLRVDTPIARPLNFVLHGRQGALAIALDAAQWPAISPLQSLSDTVRRDAASGLLLAGMLAALRATGWMPDRVEGPLDIRPDEAGNPLRACRQVSIRLGEFNVDLLPTQASEPLARTLEIAQASRLPVASERLMRWPLRTCVALGARRLPAARLAALRPGDAVFGGLNGHLHLRIASAGGRAWAASARIENQEKIMITEPFGEEADYTFEAAGAQAMDDHREHARTESALEGHDSLHALSSLSRLPMDIRYEIDGPDLTVAQAAELMAGDVLTLPVPTDGAVVHLRCQGRTIAQGELVNIGGQLGVRITEAGESTWSA